MKSLIFLLFLASAASAEMVELGACFRPVLAAMGPSEPLDRRRNISGLAKTCRKMVADLHEGDEVAFSDAKSFRLGLKLGAGGSAAVWSLTSDPSAAIRIPLGNPDSFHRMETFRGGWSKLKRLRFPAVKIVDPENKTEEYQLVERVRIKFTFWQWNARLKNPDAYRGLISKSDFNAALDDLPTVAQQSAMVAYMAEGLQMGFDGRHWRLFDFGAENLSFVENRDNRSLAQATVWDDEISDEKLKRQIAETVLGLRSKLCTLALEKRQTPPVTPAL